MHFNCVVCKFQHTEPQQQVSSKPAPTLIHVVIHIQAMMSEFVSLSHVSRLSNECTFCVTEIHDRKKIFLLYPRDIRPENILKEWSYCSCRLGFCFERPDGFAGTAVFCAEEYAQNWIIDNPIQYQARYDCESLLKCFYIMIKPKLRLKFKKQLNPNQKLQSAITAWKETADLDPKFKSYLFQIAQGTANPYQVLKDFVNFIWKMVMLKLVMLIIVMMKWWINVHDILS